MTIIVSSTSIFTILIIVGYVISFFCKRKEGTKFPRKNTFNNPTKNKHEEDDCHFDEIVPLLLHKVSSFNDMGIAIVAISDTHGHHRKIDMPPGDILIHGGDFTNYGKKEDADDFNEWLEELPYKHKIVVNGNHEINASWKQSANVILSNARLLIDEGIEIDIDGDRKKIIKIHGMNFSWPIHHGTDPRFDKIEDQVDILISHCPVKGYVDRNKGCPTLKKVVERIKPKIVICGHEHNTRGVVVSMDGHTTFVNCATAKGGIRYGNSFGKQPIVLNL